MNCGAPRGYFICDFACSGYSLAFRQIGGDGQLSVSTDSEGRLAVNVFGGSREGTVRVRSRRGNLDLQRMSVPAPEVLARIESNHAMTREYRRAHREEFIPLRRMASPHIWITGTEDTPPAAREWITVRYRDAHMRFRTRVQVP